MHANDEVVGLLMGFAKDVSLSQDPSLQTKSIETPGLRIVQEAPGAVHVDHSGAWFSPLQPLTTHRTAGSPLAEASHGISKLEHAVTLAVGPLAVSAPPPVDMKVPGTAAKASKSAGTHGKARIHPREQCPGLPALLALQAASCGPCIGPT